MADRTTQDQNPDRSQAEKPISLDRHRVAVLPFTNMSPDPADEYFADGMTEELIMTMSKIEQFEVISRTSIMQFKKIQNPSKKSQENWTPARSWRGAFGNQETVSG